MKKNKGLLVLVVILSLLVLSLSGYIVYDKFFNLDNDINEEQKQQGNNNQTSVHYSFGDVVNISKMSAVKGFDFGGDEITDFSKWYVLSDKDNIVTLYSDEAWGKDSVVKDYSYLFEEYGVTVENVRGLDEIELEFLGCDISKLSCTNTPAWAKNSVTSVYSEKSVILFEGDKLDTISTEGELVPVRPVVVITRSNLEKAMR